MAWPDDPISLPDWLPGLVTVPQMTAKITTRLNLLVDRVKVTSDVTTGVFTAANGSTITAQRGRIEGSWAVVYCAYTIGSGAGTPISPPTDGNISNVAVLNISAAYQTAMGFSTWGLQTGGIGRLAGHVVSGTQILLASVSGTANIATGDAFSFVGRYPLT